MHVNGAHTVSVIEYTKAVILHIYSDSNISSHNKSNVYDKEYGLAVCPSFGINWTR